jgi:hypothetical protein
MPRYNDTGQAGICAQARAADAEASGAKILDFSNPSQPYQPPPYPLPPKDLQTRAVEALESIAVSLERLADEHGAAPEPTPEDIARHQEIVRWLG